MSKKKAPVHISENQRDDENKKFETSRRSREIASYYTDDMSKEAVGNLFKNYNVDEESTSSEEHSEEQGKPVVSEHDEDKEYIDYINSYTKLKSKSQESKKGLSESEMTQLNRHGPRKTSVSLSSKDGGKQAATLRHERVHEPEDDFPEDSLDTDKPGSLRSVSSVKQFIANNIAYLSLGALIIVLIIFVSLILRINYLDGRLKAADTPEDKFIELQNKYNNLLISEEDLNKKIEELTGENETLKSQLASSNATAQNSAAPTSSQAPEQSQTAAPSISPGTVSGSGTKYIIEEKDTLWSIAVKFYGKGELYTKIVEANNLTNETLKIGTELIIPQ